MTKKMPSKPHRRILFHDIEVIGKDNIFPSVEIASDQIGSISFYDNYMNKIYDFFYREDIQIDTGKKCVIENVTYKYDHSNREIPCTIRYYNNERKMEMDIVRFVHDLDPDILTGWNSNDFDVPYIVHRLRHPQINLKNYSKFLSTMMKVYVVDESRGWGKRDSGGKKHQKKFSAKKKRYRPMMGGRICFDMMSGYINFKGKHEDGHSLKAVSSRELTITKTTDHISEMDWYWNDIPRFLTYNRRDTECCVEIEDKVDVIGFHDFVQTFNGCLWDKLYQKSIIVDSFMLMHAGNIALPTKIPHEREFYEGAVVFKPRPGIYGREKTFIVCFDLAKMYPNNIRSGNLSPEMIVPKEEPNDPKRMIIFPNGHRFWKPVCVPKEEKWNAETMVEMDKKWFWRETVGFVPEKVTEMFQIRFMVEAEMKEHDYGSYEYENLLGKRQNVKDTINSVYGWLAYPGSRVYEIAIAETITFMGRELILWTSKIAKNLGYETIYGDTDSIFIEIPADNLDDCIEKCKEINKKIEESYNDLAAQWNISDHFFGIDYEKILSFMMFTEAKKRYIGMLLWADGREVFRNLSDGSKKSGQLYYRGIELRRSDSAWITKEVQRNVFTMLGDNASRKEIFDYLYLVIENYLDGKYTPLQIGIPKGLGRNFDEYEVTSPWITGSIYANDYLRGNFGKGSKPKLLYIKDVRGMTYPKTDSVCIDMDMPDLPPDFVIDYEKMIEKTIRSNIDFVLDAMEINWDEMITGMKSEDMNIWIEN